MRGLTGRRVPAVRRPHDADHAAVLRAVTNGSIAHTGDPRLARHLANCVLRVDARGSRLSKNARNSPRKIDLAVAAVMVLDRAVREPERAPSVGFFAWDEL